MAEAMAEARQFEQAISVLEEAVEVADRSGERYYEAELYRLKGEFLLRQAGVRRLSRAARGGDAVLETEPEVVAQAEQCFYRAIEIAQNQKAKSWELRAAISLARARMPDSGSGIHDPGFRDARSLVAKIYDTFTEGFDTPDPHEAKALLVAS
jgi:predicted ATPase